MGRSCRFLEKTLESWRSFKPVAQAVRQPLLRPVGSVCHTVTPGAFLTLWLGLGRWGWRQQCRLCPRKRGWRAQRQGSLSEPRLLISWKVIVAARSCAASSTSSCSGSQVCRVRCSPAKEELHTTAQLWRPFGPQQPHRGAWIRPISVPLPLPMCPRLTIQLANLLRFIPARISLGTVTLPTLTFQDPVPWGLVELRARCGKLVCDAQLSWASMSRNSVILRRLSASLFSSTPSGGPAPHCDSSPASRCGCRKPVRLWSRALRFCCWPQLR
mmetsp:Transcript_21044/g.47246  ORF Transcript_21044/g.47246 Transcript_21044/m.47246 type:complete len:271 (+) Transcript_21044:1598-2410(+)